MFSYLLSKQNSKKMIFQLQFHLQQKHEANSMNHDQQQLPKTILFS